MLIVQALDAARSLIDNATRQAQNIPPAVKGKADDAIARLQALETILGDPAVGPIQPGPDSLHGQVTTILAVASGNATGLQKLRGTTGLNAKLMSTIGLAKGRLSSANRLLKEALETVRTDEASKRLNLLAKVIQNADKIKAGGPALTDFLDTLAPEDRAAVEACLTTFSGR